MNQLPNYICLVLSVLILLIFSSRQTLAKHTTYNISVASFGAKGDGHTDSTKAFLKAWDQACKSAKATTIYVPHGRYLINGKMYFKGKQCKSKDITIRIDGTLVAPSDYKVLSGGENWIVFQEVRGVKIMGGTLDSQGGSLWTCKASGKDCPKGAKALQIKNSKNILVSGLSLLNSQKFHMIIVGCNKVKVEGLNVSAPHDSPNTDGIHVSSSSGVHILNSKISTGDDCISIGPGTNDIRIENIACGPGHGVSIGSLGKETKESGVTNVRVKTVIFTGTQNGVRIKTWGKPSTSFVNHVLFQNITMVNVKNPIIIDQNYCPDHKGCTHQASGVKIHDVTYQDIHGTTESEFAVKFDCSKKYPCSGIRLKNVNLSYRNKKAKSLCVNAEGTASGLIQPSSCLPRKRQRT